METKNGLNFIILTTQRSGSTFLSSILNSHDQINFFGEIYIIDSIFNKKVGHDLFTYEEFLNIIPRNLLYRLSPKMSNYLFLKYVKYRHVDQSKVNGFKLMLSHLNYRKEISHHLNELKVIKLYRKNVFEQFLSLSLAKKYDSWVYSGNNEKQITLDSSSIIESLDKLYKKNLVIKEKKTLYDSLICEYEDLVDVSKRPTILNEIQDFLGVEKKHLISSMVKQTRDKHLVITNYEEIEKKIRESKYSYCLK